MTYEKVLKAINSKDVSGKCPMCERNEWSINPKLYATMAIDKDGNFIVGEGVSPLIQMTCKNCGHVAHFNPLILGLEIE